MGDLPWKKKGFFCFPQGALRLHATALGTSGSGKSETLLRIAYGAYKVYHQQVIFLDAKGDTKREEEQGEDNAARFVAAMLAAGASKVKVFPALYYNGWLGTPTELKNRLLSVIDYSESAYYGDVAANALDLALGTPTTPRSSRHFLSNLSFERLKVAYQHNPEQYRRVLQLDEHHLQQVEMRYRVFFSAMAGQLDGTLDYNEADAVYLRVRGFTLRNEAPRLGRFLISDFMHYIAERRRTGTQTLLIIDEFNALRMREETSILFEQVRSFGGNLVISAQGYAGLGPQEYAERILDACSTYILHACSDPGPVTRRAGKRFRLDTSWSEDEEGIERKHIKLVWDWRVSETNVIQQTTGQAYWIHRGHAQQVQTAQIPITVQQVREGWSEIRQLEALQRQMLELEAQRELLTHAQKPPQKQLNQEPQIKSVPKSSSPAAPTSPPSKKEPAVKTSTKKSGLSQKGKVQKRQGADSLKPGRAVISPPDAELSPTPVPDPYDDEPDRL